MLLARVADGIYWIGRCAERAECTARIVASHANLFFDIPVGSGVGWEPLLAITGTRSRFDDARSAEAPDSSATLPATEADVVRFLVTKPENPSSIAFSVANARNNMRSCRQRLPREAWEAMNRFYLYVAEDAPAIDDRAGRFRYLSHLVVEAQKLTGILHGTMTRDPAYAFFMLGQNLERADMTTRVLDVHAELLALRGTPDARFDDVLWMYALKSLAAFQMFRRATAGAGGAGTLRFLVQDHSFPRSVAFCLDEVAHQLKGLANSDEALDACASALRYAHDHTPEALEGAALHAFVDGLQRRLDGVHDAVTAAWLRVAVPEPAAERVMA